MFLRWRRRPLQRAQDTALDALLVQSVWQDGAPRQRVVCYLATIRARYRLAPAHRHAFWHRAERRLGMLHLAPAARRALEARLAQQVPRPTPEELAEVQAWRQTLAQWDTLRSSASPSAHDHAGLHSDGH